MDEEIKKAQTAKPEEVTIFDKIINKEIPANIIFEDELVSSNDKFIRLRHLHSVMSDLWHPRTS
jgi:hypothetical protein